MSKDDIIHTKLYIPEEKVTCNLGAVKVAENQYQLANNDPYGETLIYGTVIETRPRENEEGTLEFIRIIEHSKFNLQVIPLPTQLNNEELVKIAKMILKEGGYWEVIFGGMGYVNLPKDSKINILEEINLLIKNREEK